MKSIFLSIALTIVSSMALAQAQVSPFQKAVAEKGYSSMSRIFDCNLQTDDEAKAPIAVCTLENMDKNIGIVVFGNLKMNSNGAITSAVMISHDAD